MMAQNANNLSDQKPKFTDRLLKIFSEVKPGESITVLILLFDVFLLLFGYSLLKPVREALVLAQSEKDLLMQPFVALGAYGLIGLGVGFAATRWLKTAENSTDYSVMNTGRAMLWLPTTREEKIQGETNGRYVFCQVR